MLNAVRFKSSLTWVSLLVPVVGVLGPLFAAESTKDVSLGLLPFLSCVVAALLLAWRERMENEANRAANLSSSGGSLQRQSIFGGLLALSERVFNSVLIFVACLFALAVASSVLGHEPQPKEVSVPVPPDCDSVLQESEAEGFGNRVVIGMVAAGYDVAKMRDLIQESEAEYRFDAENLYCLGDAGVPPSALKAMLPVEEEPEEPVVPKPKVRKVEEEKKPKIEPPVDPKPRSAKVTLSVGTAVLLRLNQELSSKTAQVGQSVLFTVESDVVVRSKTVIAAGATARGNVTQAKKGRTFGRKGVLDFTVDVVEAVTGEQIPLKLSRSLEGNDRDGAMEMTSRAAGAVGDEAGGYGGRELGEISGGFIKGKNVVLNAGTVFTVFTNRAITLQQQP